ncbi:MAG: efflux RND transporter periplasmic adaptor subunit [Candidatus Paceibacterota bacterium]
MLKIPNLLKQKKYIYMAVGAFVLIAGVGFLFKNGKTTNDTLTVVHSDFINQVYVSGKVVASEEVDMAFKKEGVVDRVFYKVGDVVKLGYLIAKIDAKEAEKSMHDAEISLASAELALEKFKLESSQGNLNADLEKAYDDGFSAVEDAFLDLATIMTGLEDILNEDNISDSAVRNSGNTALLYKRDAEKFYVKVYATFKENRDSFRLLNRSSSNPDIEAIIDKTYETTKVFADALKSTKNLIDYMIDDTNNTTNFADSKNSLSDYTDTINGHMSSLSSAGTNIDDSKDAFSTTDLDVKDYELTVKQKEISLQDARKNLADYYIRAPFEGVVTKIDAKVGEVATPNTALITMMSADTFQIESFVPEVNIALIKLGHEARVTLDAYGENVLFNAKVVSIDPAETIRDGVSTYKIKLQFNEKDERVKSGMTANVSIIIFDKPNVIVVPGGVVYEKDGKKFVQVKTDKEVSNREVVTGDVSALGQVEVVSGLEDGELVILNPSTE